MRYQLAQVDISHDSASPQIHLLRSVTCLGVIIDQELSFADHVSRLTARCSYWLRQLRTVRHALT